MRNGDKQASNIDLPDPLLKSYAPKKGEEMNRSTYSTMRYNEIWVKIGGGSRKKFFKIYTADS